MPSGWKFFFNKADYLAAQYIVYGEGNHGDFGKVKKNFGGRIKRIGEILAQGISFRNTLVNFA